MGKLFGTDGVRGVANVFPMDPETVMRLGRAAAHVLRRNKGRHQILIGKDTRVSGYMIETALASGITSMGVDVLLVGPLPTPGVAYLARSMRVDAGVMISASHNPWEDNGIKFFGGDGFKLADATEAEIERLLEPGHLDEIKVSPDLIGKASRIDDAVGRYTVFLKNVVDRDVSLEGKRIVLDCANGAAYKVAPLVFHELGAEVIRIGDKPDGKNINAGCGSLYPDLMVKEVKASGAFCGIAFDGDADRVIMCDEQGNVFDGETILAVLAEDFASRGILRGSSIVGTTMTNYGFEQWLESRGLTLIRSDVGDRYVLAEMQANGCNLGGEQSGHVIALDHNTTGDGILSALLVLCAMVRRNEPMSSARDLVPRCPQILRSIRVTKKPPLEDVPALQEVLTMARDRLSSRGRVVMRYSGTEPKVRIMVECFEADLCAEVADSIESVVAQTIASGAS